MTVKLLKVPESEQQYLGSILRRVLEGDYGAAHELVELVPSSDLENADYSVLHGAMRRLLSIGEPFDHFVLLTECNGHIQSPQLQMAELLEAAKANAAQCESHARLIRNAAEQRRAVYIAKSLADELGKTGDAAATVERFRSKLDEALAPRSKPEPIKTEKYQPFPLATLPATVAKYVDAAATAIGCDPSFIALPLLGCLARAIGNKRVIRLKRSWTEPAIIWAAIIGKSGTHKTPALSAATTFLSRKQTESINAYQQNLVHYEQEKALYERDYAAWKRSRSTDPPPWQPEVPLCERFITTDCTIEALSALLHGQFDGVLIPRDELSGWLGGIAEYKGGQGSDLGHWLASWSASPLTVDRKTGTIKMIHIPRASVSIVGGIQPDVLRRAIGHEHMQDGLCARMLLAMPDRKQVTWTDATIDQATEAAMGAVFDRLIGMTSGADGDGNPEPFAVPLSSYAKALWIEYYNRHRAESLGLEDDLAAAWSKLEAYAARFALIFQMCSWADGMAEDHEIDADSIQAGIELSDWFGNEARRVYGMFSESSDDREHRELVELVRSRGGRVVPRDLQVSVRKFRASGVAEAALDDLARAGYGQWKVVATGRRPRREFVLSELSTVSTSTLFNGSAELRNSVDVDSVGSGETDANSIPF